MTTIIPPCPDWCVLPDGHSYAESGPHGVRTHESIVAIVTPAAGDGSAYSGASVATNVDEHAYDDRGPDYDEREVFLECHGVQMTPAEARQVADLLRDAADRAER